MTVEEMIIELAKRNPKAVLRFSVAIDTSEDAGQRWFCEDGIEEIIDDGNRHVGIKETEVTVCLIGKSNL